MYLSSHCNASSFLVMRNNANVPWPPALGEGVSLCSFFPKAPLTCWGAGGGAHRAARSASILQPEVISSHVTHWVASVLTAAVLPPALLLPGGCVWVQGFFVNQGRWRNREES